MRVEEKSEPRVLRVYLRRMLTLFELTFLMTSRVTGRSVAANSDIMLGSILAAM